MNALQAFNDLNDDFHRFLKSESFTIELCLVSQ